MTQIFLLAIIQGVTEFLPVSSSGHLNLLHGLTDLPDQGIIIDVAVHAGTLLAVMIYFRHDVLRLLHGGIEILSPQSATGARNKSKYLRTSNNRRTPPSRCRNRDIRLSKMISEK